MFPGVCAEWAWPSDTCDTAYVISHVMLVTSVSSMSPEKSYGRSLFFSGKFSLVHCHWWFIAEHSSRLRMVHSTNCYLTFIELFFFLRFFTCLFIYLFISLGFFYWFSFSEISTGHTPVWSLSVINMQLFLAVFWPILTL